MDKAPDLGLPFFYRVILPGAIVTLLATPVFRPLLTGFGIDAKDQAPYLVAIGIFIGFILSLLDEPIYEVLEGRTGWPKWLAKWRQRRWQTLVDEKYKLQDRLAEDNPDYAECWAVLRQFPVDASTDTPIAAMPSRIGNVIASYEQYPLLRYKMDDVFYWPRLWLLLDNDARNAIDNQWASVDAILYTGVGVATLGALYFLLGLISFPAALFRQGGSISGVGRPLVEVVVGVALLSLFFVCIRIAVPGLLSAGENYKSVFDLYRSKLTFKEPTKHEQEIWRRTAMALQYGTDDDEPTTRR